MKVKFRLLSQRPLTICRNVRVMSRPSDVSSSMWDFNGRFTSRTTRRLRPARIQSKTISNANLILKVAIKRFWR